jgi:FixJ family two-component response regulator
MPAERATVYVIDDDDSVRRALARLLKSAGFTVCTFASARAFLEADCPPENCCVVADVRMDGMSGLQLQHELTKAGSPLHVILITAHDTEETRIEAIEAGAAALFFKPVDDQALLDAIQWTLARGGCRFPGAYTGR